MAEQVIDYALTTRNRVKDRMSITAAGFDTLFDRLVSGVTDFIESQCGRRFKETAYSGEVYSIYNDGQKHLLLKQFPVSVLSSIQYAAGIPGNKVWTNYGASDYELVMDGKDGVTSESGLVRFYGFLPKGTNTIKVAYTAGYKIDFSNAGNSTHTLPFDISDLAERLIVRWFKRREAEGKSSEGTGDARVDWAKELSAEDLLTIDRYKRVLIV